MAVLEMHRIFIWTLITTSERAFSALVCVCALHIVYDEQEHVLQQYLFHTKPAAHFMDKECQG